MNNQNRLAIILSFLGQKKKIVFGLPLTLLFIVVIYASLVRFGVIKDPFPLPGVPFIQKGPQVSIKTEYKNPFDKKTQFVNPFDDYKNPFTIAK